MIAAPAGSLNAEEGAVIRNRKKERDAKTINSSDVQSGYKSSATSLEENVHI